MEKITFIGAEALAAGIEKVAALLQIELAEGGIVFTCEKCDTPTLEVSLDGRRGLIRYAEPCQFFRALGLAVEHIRDGEQVFAVREKPQFKMNGVMFDMSQGNAAFNQRTMKEMLDRMAIMGLNTAMLYCEDNYEVENQPYFGYMRPSFTMEQMRELDDYAYELGIEMIPCIQTLAHMPDALRWSVYDEIKDYAACLLVGEEKTYQFLDDVIRSASAPFRSKKIHIGMDEAWELGTGQYLKKNGYRKNGEIIKEHLDRVIEIIRKYGLEPMMWDDMFFTAFGDGTYRQTATPVPDFVRDMVPPEMRCIYWDYGNSSDLRIERQKELSDKIVFAGGCWAWLAYGMAYDWTLKSSNNALALCRKHNIREVFLTTWGDNGVEAPEVLNLFGAQIFAENGYADEFDEAKFEKRLRFCTGAVASDLRALQYMDMTPDTVGLARDYQAVASKYLMWQDILTGLMDKNIEGVPLRAHYEKLAEALRAAVGRNGYFDPVFRLEARAAEVLAQKAEMGLRLTAAYRAADRETLRRIAEEELPTLYHAVEALCEEHRELWLRYYKPLGWDILDLRYGGLLNRIRSAAKAVSGYLAGKRERIEELEVERLPFNGKSGPPLWYNFYGKYVSPSRIDPYA